MPESGVPIGTVIAFAGEITAGLKQAGWLECDGTELKEPDYPDLSKVLAGRYGGSSGTFNLPNLKGSVICGVGEREIVPIGYPKYSVKRELAKPCGDDLVQLAAASLPKHQHSGDTGPALKMVSVRVEEDSGSPIAVSSANDGGPDGSRHTHPFTTKEDGGENKGFEVMQPTMPMTFLIKAR